jgi:hypothetical protein
MSNVIVIKLLDASVKPAEILTANDVGLEYTEQIYFFRFQISQLLLVVVEWFGPQVQL